MEKMLFNKNSNLGIGPMNPLALPLVQLEGSTSSEAAKSARCAFLENDPKFSDVTFQKKNSTIRK